MNIDLVAHRIENNYKIDIEDIEKIKNVYKIKSKEGHIYSLKIINYEFKHFNFILNSIKHLENNGFNGVLPFIKTKCDEDYIELDNNTFGYINPWISCRDSNYDNPIEVERIGKFLGELHLKSRGFSIKDNMKPRIAWMSWYTTFYTRKNEILDFKNRIEKKHKKTAFDELYYNNIERNIQLCNETLVDIIDSSYINRMRDEMMNKGFCHHDTAHHNILITEENQLKIIDFDYCILDTHLHDLGSLIIRVLKNGKWHMNTAINILNSYNDVYKLSYDEIPIIAAFIKFPQDFWQIGIQYYWERKSWEEEFFEKKLFKILDDMEERNDFSKELKSLYKGGLKGHVFRL
ncbi:CotS family spore coat protein [Clostridium sp.]|uniref:CotS family spore coat protein n=1 Tax=Clostridium sp. TaxID=1506 RepID=UPI0034645AF6